MTTREFIEQVREYYLLNEGPLRNVHDDVQALVQIVETYERALEEYAECDSDPENAPITFASKKALADAQKVLGPVEGKSNGNV